ncbi:transglutaminase family protein [Limnohabitans radicicola]|uniref:Transglutaminase family protein n=1 Tax=Limnohabitans radicicola TaxID=2771427 RepID=A0A927IM20_9BURK|nr:transglutaminase family protein [Limnohabitans radicicola]MBD8050735.1 transglutaminase family protein [Limnohabitans radicicola]
MRLSVLHDTLYRYSPAVETAQHIAYLRPRDTACQQLVSHTLAVEPPPGHLSTRTDAFGNQPAHWALAQTHDTLRVSAHSEVITRTLPVCTSSQSWEAVREHFRYRSGHPADPQASFVFGSHHAPLNEAFAAYARPCFAPGRALTEAATALMHQIHSDFTYASQSTDIHTPALQALQARRGVCQDFAHILIACLRSLGLPARYVSGYLLTHAPEGQPRLVGSDASHAWASVYIPELANTASQGWLDLDPTNDRHGWASPGEDYVQLAVGRDFADVSPLRGVLQGGTSHTLEVGVTVEPLLTPEDPAHERLRHPEIPEH